MLTIEINQTEVIRADFSKIKRKYLIVNGIFEESSHFSNEKKFPCDYAYFYDAEVINILTSYSFSENANYFKRLNLAYHGDWWEYDMDFEIDFDKHIVQMMLKIDWQDWAKAYSMSTFAKEFESNVIALSNPNVTYYQDDPDSMLNGFGINYLITDFGLMMEDLIDNAYDITEMLVDLTNKNLMARVDKEAILTYFQFPKEIKVACKQYLTYFAQFIEDIGIMVDTEIKDEANQTLFKITPEDKEQGLNKIKEALEIYLNAPGDKNFQIEVANYNDVSVRQWEAHIYHLKSQIALANSILQMKDATIESLQLSNYQYKQLLDSKESKGGKDEGEDVIEGVVTVKKYEGKAFSVNLPEIFRRLKRKFKM